METTGRRLVYFAAERTLLTWIRIALTLMGFGFIIDRFDLVFSQTFMDTNLRWLGKTIPSWAGSGMVAMGTLVSLVAAASYTRFSRRYRTSGDTTPGSGLLFGVILALVVALFGIAIVALLLAISA
jgi:putative membrane protein